MGADAHLRKTATKEGTVARVEGFEPAQSGQQPVDVNGDPAAVGVWGDSSTGIGAFGTSGEPLPNFGSIPARIAGVEGHSYQHPGVDGVSIEQPGVQGESLELQGVFGRSETDHGVLGVTNAPTVPGERPSASGVRGVSLAGGQGVTGVVLNTTGVVGSSIRGLGVEGVSGDADGISGLSLNANGVRGVGGTEPTGGGQTPCGVSGFSPTGFGVRGEASENAGVVGVTFGGSGIVGVTLGGRGNGVSGGHMSTEPGSGVYGGSSLFNGVDGFSFNGIGVRGEGGNGGVRGFSTSASGVSGSSSTGVGVRGDASENSGIVGVTSGRGDGATAIHFSTEPGSGVSGLSIRFNGVDGFSFTGIGVRGEGRNGGVHGFSNSAAADAAAILGQNADGFAGVFLGKVRVSGFLSKAGGGFEIDHPLDPANTYLRHSFVECPEMLNVYGGNATTDDKGEAGVALPTYFEALNEDFRYQLTVIGQFAQAIVAEEIRNNRFTIKTDQPQVKVSWQVTGIRRDPWAVANRMVVEEDKAAEDKGHYLHPELWGQSAEASMHRSEAQQAQTGEDRLRQITQLLPEGLSVPARRHLEALVRGEHVKDEELQSLMLEAKQQTGLEAAMHRSEAQQAQTGEDQLRQITQLLPEGLSARARRHLEALARGEHVKDEELQSLMLEAKQQAGLAAAGEPPRADRARLEEELHRIEELVHSLGSMPLQRGP
jgi:hypothetical protein